MGIKYVHHHMTSTIQRGTKKRIFIESITTSTSFGRSKKFNDVS